jgi:hypothetical protein
MSRSMHLDNRRHPVKRAAALSTLTLLAATALGTTAGPAPRWRPTVTAPQVRQRSP